MSSQRTGMGIHVLLLVAAAGAAGYVWTRGEKATAAVTVGDVTVWSGRSEDVRRVAFEGKGKKVALEAKSDATGRWFTGTAVTTPAKADGGTAASAKTSTFISVASGEKLATALAPLRATRDLGKLEDARAGEFGLDEPEGTLTVTIGDVEHQLVVGGSAPGGSDRYVRDPATGEAYAVKGDFVRDLVTGESALAEHDLHGFKDGDVDHIRVTAHGKTREVLRRGPESKRIWADPKDPDKADETAANWITKVDRLKPTEFLTELEGTPETVVRIDYSGGGTHGAFLELAKVKPAGPLADDAKHADAKPDYVVRTERTRLWAKVPGTVAEQVEQDSASIVP